MQHDLFHRYTVDAHTLLVIRNLRRFTQPEEEKLFPVAAHIMKNLPKPELLYISGLYHDIGKGRGGDHSTLGAVDAQHFCERHNVSPRDTRLVTWLVEKHLLMSYVSQKKDISDPDVIHNFALQIGDQLRLDYLYALTVADMCGTNPEIWNSWRASLMRQLYSETKRALRRGLENTVDLQDMIEEKQYLARLKLETNATEKIRIDSLWHELGDEYFIRESHHDIAWQTREILSHDSEGPLVVVRESSNPAFKGATQIFIRMKNAQHVFMAAATSLAQQGLNIQDAKIYTSSSGYTNDTFYVLDEQFNPIGSDPLKLAKIANELKNELALVGEYSTLQHRRTPRQLKQFAIPTKTFISNDLNNGYTVLEVISPDRPGLLATIAKIFMDMDIELVNAKVSTLGERVEDIFFITSSDGSAIGDAVVCEALQREICRQLDYQVEQEKLA